MRGVYDVGGKISNFSAAKAMIRLKAPAAAIVELLSFSLTDETGVNQQLTGHFYRASSDGTNAASSATPVAHETGDQAAGTNCAIGNFGTDPAVSTAFPSESQNGMGGWYWDAGDEDLITIEPGGRLVFILDNAPSAFDADVKATFRERG
jgi:hypothetical protein